MATTLAVTGIGVLVYKIYERFKRSEILLETDAGPIVPNLTKYGKPVIVQELKKPGYLIVYSNQTRTPAYVIERLLPGSFEDGHHVDREHLGFYSEAALVSNRATNADYTGSGYDRGHMAAAANHTSCQDATLETFTLSNTIPQFPACNRGNWKTLENHARALVKTSAGVYVYSGPLYIPQQAPNSSDRFVVYQVIGANTVAVPTHFFKVMVVEPISGRATVECYIVENSPDVKSLSLEQMRVGLEEVEGWSGLVFDKLHKFL